MPHVKSLICVTPSHSVKGTFGGSFSMEQSMTTIASYKYMSIYLYRYTYRCIDTYTINTSTYFYIDIYIYMKICEFFYRPFTKYVCDCAYTGKISFKLKPTWDCYPNHYSFWEMDGMAYKSPIKKKKVFSCYFGNSWFLYLLYGMSLSSNKAKVRSSRLAA